MSTFVSHLPVVLRFMREAGCASVTAAAIVVTNKAKMLTRGGFTSGAFVTRGWQGIRWRSLCQGLQPRAQVGHHEKHWAFWEMGHHNIFMRRYVRFAWLSRAMLSTHLEQERAAMAAQRQVARKYAGVMGAL